MSIWNPEEALLGCLLRDNATYWQVAATVTADDFSTGTYRQLFGLITGEIKAGNACDPFTLTDSAGYDLGMAALKIWDAGGATSMVESYGEAVRKNGEARRLKQAGANISVCESYEDAQRLLAAVRPTQAQRVKTVRDGLSEMVEAIQRRYDADGAVSGIPTGIDGLDELTSGWQAGNLIVVAARPGMGKTAFALQAALVAGRALFFSLEMTAGELTERAVANLGQFPLKWITRPKDEETPDYASARVLEASKMLAKVSLLVDDQPSQTVDAICSRARQAHMQEPLSMVIVDHLGLIARPGKHDPSELGVVTSQLKRLAKDLGISVVLLCQLNRGLESRTDKRPVMADLRDSGRIEEDADIVICLYRAEYYGEKPEGFVELIVRKNRSGERGTAFAVSRLAQMRMESTDEKPDTGPASPTGSNGGHSGFSSSRGTGGKPRPVPGNR